MALYVGNREIGEVLVGALPIGAVYIGSMLIWPEEEPVPPIEGTACYSVGIWEDTLTWVDSELWADTITQ